MQIGYCLSCEQFTPGELLEQAKLAERCGFAHLLVSDHFQPWVPAQGQSCFAWSLLGALGQVCGLPFATGVTAPGFRFHPALIAQAAATLEVMYPGRFTLGLGTGEALNEHITGEYWPEPHERVQRLLEAVDIIQRLLQGQEFHHSGQYFRMEKTRLYTLPEYPPALAAASSGPYLSQKIGGLGLTFLTVQAEREKVRQLLERYAEGLETCPNGAASPKRWLQLHVSWDKDYDTACANALREWPNGAMNFPKADIRYPQVLEAIARGIRPEDFAGRMLISSDAADYHRVLREAEELGFDTVFIHNVGRNQAEFMRFAAQEGILRN